MHELWELLERLRHPRAGWLSIGLLAVMALSLVWSVQGAAWLEQLGFLVPVALVAVLLGAILGALRPSIVVSLPVAAMVGALVVVWTVAGEYHPLLDPAGRINALRDEVAGWVVVMLRTGYPAQMSPYAIGLGLLAWTTAFMAAYVVYRYQRVLDAILLVGAALIVNMSATYTDLFGQLVLFVLASLLLWLRAALLGRQDSWQRRRVTESPDVPAAILRSGVSFTIATVTLAWVLTSVAVAAPLTGAWNSLDGVWSDMRDTFDGVFGTLTNPQSRIRGTSFGSSFTVSGSWVSNEEEVLVVTASRPLYLRTAAYDRYTGRGWERTDGAARQVPAGDALFAATSPEHPAVADAFAYELVTIEMRQTIGRNLFTPGHPMHVYAPAVVQEPANQPVFGGIEAANPFASGEGYQVQAALSEATQAELSAAGTDYPEAIRALYLDASLATERVRDQAALIAGDADDPYRQADRLARWLSRDETFTYATNAPVPPPGADLVDFFLHEGDRTGYCQYFASAMVLMARTLGIPARVAVGFAPGERTEGEAFLVREANAHAWAELYFPGYGWQIFEATQSVNAGFTRLAGGPVDPNRQLISVAELERLLGEDLTISEPDFFVPGGGGFAAREGEPPVPEDQARGGNAALFAGIVLLLAVAAGWRAHRLRQRWRLLPAGDRTWQRVAHAAGRAGIGPRPSETIYEYAGWLEEQIPRRRTEVRTVAQGKVWQSYSGRRMTRPAADRLEAAWRRLRLPLVLLAVRRGLRGLVRRT